jgi:hypothetical protein
MCLVINLHLILLNSIQTSDVTCAKVYQLESEHTLSIDIFIWRDMVYFHVYS